MAANIPVEVYLEGKEKVLSGLKDIGAAVGSAFAVEKIFEFARATREAAKEDELAQNRLNAAIGGVSAALNIQAQNLSKQYVMQQGEIVRTQQIISLHIQNKDAIQKLTPAILNMALATGQSAESIADQLTSAIQTGRGLRGYGITIKECTTEQERIESITRQVNARFGEQAKASVECKDPLDKLTISMGEFMGQVGNFSKLPIVADALNMLTEAFGAFNDMATRAAQDEATKEIVAKTEKMVSLGAHIKELQSQLASISETQQKIVSFKGGKVEIISRAQIESEIAKLKEEQQLLMGNKKGGGITVGDGVDDEVFQYQQKQQELIDKIVNANMDKEAQRKKDNTNAVYAWERELAEARHAAAISEINELEKLKIEGEINVAKKEAELEKQKAEAKDFVAEIIEGEPQSAKRGGDTNKLKQLQKEQKNEKKQLDKFLKEKLISEKEYQQALTSLDKQYSQARADQADEERKAKVAFAMSTTDSLIGLMGDLAEATGASAKERKRIAQAEAGISAAKGAIGVVENAGQFISSFGPIAGPIIMGVELAAVIGLGIAQIAKIEKAKLAYGGTASGSIVTGGTSGQDSVNALLMPGEIVYNPMHPNPALAQIVSNSVGGTTNNGNTTTIGGTTIIVNGSVDQKTIKTVQVVTEKAVLTAIKKAQVNGKIHAPGLTVRTS
jgi:hypothetical protein